MGENSKIQWTHHTFNPWMGCTKVHEGCANCYAERDIDHRYHKAKWGPSGTRVLTSDENWKKPLKWDQEAEAAGERRRVFCASLADIFEGWTGELMNHKGHRIAIVDGGFSPVTHSLAKLADKRRHETRKGLREPSTESLRWATLDDVRRRLFRMIDATPHLDWLLLTKRPENIRPMIPCRLDTNCDGDCHLCSRDGSVCRRRDNMWLGTSVSLQAHLENQLWPLVQCRDIAPVRFVSAEPLLGLLDFREVAQRTPSGGRAHPLTKVLESGQINWVICGGESGPEAREFVLEYSLDLLHQCKKAGVAFFEKQFGAFPVTTNVNLWDFISVRLQPWGEYAASARILLRDPKGGDPFEWPDQFRVREFPKVEMPA